jgi:hypothetical protein
VFYYELHDGDDDLFTDALLAHELEFTEDEYFQLVMDARAKVIERFSEDTLVEAVAHELERSAGFVYIDDGRLCAAVNVSRIDDENFIASIEPDDEEDEEDADFRTVVVKLDSEQMN